MESSTQSPNRLVLIAAWVVMLLVSILPDAIVFELTGSRPAWLFPVKIAVLGVAAGAALLIPALRPLLKYTLIILGIYTSEWLVGALVNSPLWIASSGGASAPFTQRMFFVQVSRLIVSLAVIGVLLALGFRRQQFFLAVGNLRAPITPVRWLGFPKPDPWTRFGGQFAVYIGLGLLVFLILGGRPDWAAFPRALPLLPMVLLLASMNAFNEEMTYRASLLAGLEPAAGARQALWITAAFFGLGHYFGVPYGVVGVIMAGFLGWMLGKAMLETRGFFWAWFIHFVQDVLIFSFMAVGSITPGGG